MKARGEITVFLSMCLLSVAALLCVMLESARTAGSKYYFQTAVNSGLDTLFSRYHRQLWDEYQILALEYGVSEELTASLENYVEEYLTVNNWYPMELKSMEVAGIIGIADDGGEHMADEVLKYMKYGAVSQFLFQPQEGEQFLKDVAEGAGAGSLTDAYRGQEKEVRKLEKATEKLLENIREQESLKEDVQSALDSDNGWTFYNAAKDYRKAAKQYPKLLEAYEKQAEILKQKQKESRDDIDRVKPDLQADRGQLFESQWNPYDTYIARDGERHREFLNQKETAEENLKLLEETEEMVGWLLGDMASAGQSGRGGENSREAFCYGRVTRSDHRVFRVGSPESPDGESEPVYDDDDDDEDEEPSLAPAADLWREGYKASGISTEYGSGDKEKQNLLDQVQSLAETGLLGVVMPEGTEISNAALSSGQFPSKTPGSQGERGGAGSSVTDRVIIDEYCGHFFSSALDEGERPVKYELEYILQGKDQDRENLEKTVAELFAVREGLNLIHILSDSQKREEARGLALVIAGGTGLAPLVEIGACLIMGIWAVGESISDLRILMSGGKVPLWKSGGEWRMSLDGLLELGSSRTLAGEEGAGFDRGFDYEGYLKLLLLKENPSEKHMRMLDLMQMNIGMEKQGFLIKNCAWYVDIRGEASGKHVFFALPFVKRLTGSQTGYSLEAAAEKAY